MFYELETKNEQDVYLWTTIEIKMITKKTQTGRNRIRKKTKIQKCIVFFDSKQPKYSGM